MMLCGLRNVELCEIGTGMGITNAWRKMQACYRRKKDDKWDDGEISEW